jgi:general stress protein YciG
MPNKDQRTGSGNFANDPKRASEMGKKGAEQSGQRQQGQTSEKGPQQGSHGSQNKDRDPSHKGGQR